MKLEEVTGNEFDKLGRLTNDMHDDRENNHSNLGKIQLNDRYALILNLIVDCGTCSPRFYIVDTQGEDYKIVAGIESSSLTNRPNSILEAYHMVRFMQYIGTDMGELRNVLSQDHTAVFGEGYASHVNYVLAILFGQVGNADENGSRLLQSIQASLERTLASTKPSTLSVEGFKDDMVATFRREFRKLYNSPSPYGPA